MIIQRLVPIHAVFGLHQRTRLSHFFRTGPGVCARDKSVDVNETVDRISCLNNRVLDSFVNFVGVLRGTREQVSDFCCNSGRLSGDPLNLATEGSGRVTGARSSIFGLLDAQQGDVLKVHHHARTNNMQKHSAECTSKPVWVCDELVELLRLSARRAHCLLSACKDVDSSVRPEHLPPRHSDARLRTAHGAVKSCERLWKAVLPHSQHDVTSKPGSEFFPHILQSAEALQEPSCDAEENSTAETQIVQSRPSGGSNSHYIQSRPPSPNACASQSSSLQKRVSVAKTRSTRMTDSEAQRRGLLRSFWRRDVQIFRKCCRVAELLYAAEKLPQRSQQPRHFTTHQHLLRMLQHRSLDCALAEALCLPLPRLLKAIVQTAQQIRSSRSQIRRAPLGGAAVAQGFVDYPSKITNGAFLQSVCGHSS